jgi:very-short-patch-repair endonuclease
MSERKQRWRSTIEIQEAARSLRRGMTPAERVLWCYLRRKQQDGARFRRQHPIGRFIVDFYCAEHRLIVEVDGEIHAKQAGYDKARTELLEAQGYRILRFTNQEVCQQTLSVLAAIRAACAEPESCPHPDPPPLRRGGSGQHGEGV